MTSPVLANTMNNDLELYIHIPFCVRKCNYCDFLSSPQTEEVKEAYVCALINEIHAAGRDYGDRHIKSIFIGGGTPSILSPEQMIRITDALKESFDLNGLKGKHRTFFRKKAVEPEIEFTVECNPGTLDREKLKAYKKAGVNRLSIGLQSANDAELKELGRIHTVRDFLETYEEARMAGFENINIDLMQAIPLQTIGSWKKTLMAAAALKPEHISAYSLIIEEGTPFYDRMKSDLPLAIPDEDTEREIYYVTKEILEQFGYKRYEISNYALPGRECRHNCGYWKRTDYLGLGLGSSSMICNVRWKNISELDKYIGLFAGKREHLPEEARCEAEKLSHKDQMAEYMFLGLRMTEGISKEAFIDTFGVDYDFTYGEVTQKFIDMGLMQVIVNAKEDEKSYKDIVDTRVSLTDKGVDVSNQVFAEFL